MALPEDVRSGTLRTYGCWFGRPMDNYHRCIAASMNGNVLSLRFDGDEELEVTDPSGLAVDGKVLRIPKASKVRWAWYYYGKPKTSDNLLYYEYRYSDAGVQSDTNSPWPTQPTANAPAVELY
jgi:hypothetical protein